MICKKCGSSQPDGANFCSNCGSVLETENEFHSEESANSQPNKKPTDMKKLTRSKTNKKILGVCGGFAEYFEIDPTIVRLVWLFLVVCAGTGVLVYFIAALIMPEPGE